MGSWESSSHGCLSIGIFRLCHGRPSDENIVLLAGELDCRMSRAKDCRTGMLGIEQRCCRCKKTSEMNFLLTKHVYLCWMLEASCWHASTCLFLHLHSSSSHAFLRYLQSSIHSIGILSVFVSPRRFVVLFSRCCFLLVQLGNKIESRESKKGPLTLKTVCSLKLFSIKTNSVPSTSVISLISAYSSVKCVCRDAVVLIKIESLFVSRMKVSCYRDIHTDENSLLIRTSIRRLSTQRASRISVAGVRL